MMHDIGDRIQGKINMMLRGKLFMAVLISFMLLLLSFFFHSNKTSSSVGEIHLPEGFKIKVYASDLETPRFMAFSPDGVLFLTIIRTVKVVALPDNNKDGKADKEITFIEGLKKSLIRELPCCGEFH